MPFITQLDGTLYSGVNCGPASTAMVLAAFGIRSAPANVRDYVNYISGSYGSEQGTSLDALGRVLREAGLETARLYNGGVYQRWSTDLLREEVLAGHPVITLVKYRALPGHTASLSDWDHYIVISGLAGNDFVYNDAAYSSAAGYGLLISPDDLQRAWDYSSVPRHGMAVSYAGRVRLPTDALDLGDNLSEIDLLADADASLGDEVTTQRTFGALLFRRVAIDAEPADAVAPEAALELGDRIDPTQVTVAALPVVPPPLDPLPLQPVMQPAVQSFPEFFGPLAALAGVGLLVILALACRHAVE